MARGTRMPLIRKVLLLAAAAALASTLRPVLDPPLAVLLPMAIAYALLSAAWLLPYPESGSSTEPRAPWWASVLTVRVGVASAIALGALAMTWWGWAYLAPPDADGVMKTMVSVITAVLGYLFGRGEADATRHQAQVARSSAEESVQKAEDATQAGEAAIRALEYLAAKAQEDPRLLQYIEEATGTIGDSPR